MWSYCQEARLSPKPVSMAESQAGPTAPQLRLLGSGLHSALNGAVRAPLGDRPPPPTPEVFCGKGAFL